MKSLSFLNDLFASGTARSVCWTLVHSLWQGLACALLAAVFILLTKRSRPAFRYQVLLAVFVLFVLAVSFTFIYEQQHHHAIAGLSAVASPATTLSPGTAPYHGGQLSSETIQIKLTGFLSHYSPLIVALWLLILALKTLHMGVTLGYTVYIRRRKATGPSAFWTRKVAALAASVGVHRAVRLLESELMKVPLVFGYLKPVIFVPLGLLAQLPARQVEAILLHELAHIRRHDYLVNLLQYAVETLFFFNPALLWLSALIRDERESCCDEVALGQTGDPKQYVAALISFREYVPVPRAVLSVPFPGSRNSLVNRVARIVRRRNSSLDGVEKALLLFGCLVVVGSLLLFSQPTVGRAQISRTPTKKIAFAAVAKDTSRTLKHQQPITGDKIADYKKSHRRGVKDTTKWITGKKPAAGPDADLIAAYKKSHQKGVKDTTKWITGKKPAAGPDADLIAAYKKSHQQGIKDTTRWVMQKPMRGPDADLNYDRQRTRGVIAALVREKVVPDAASLTWFGLDAGQLVINGQKQPGELHQKLAEEFHIEAGHGLYYGPVQVTGTGTFLDKTDLH